MNFSTFKTLPVLLLTCLLLFACESEPTLVASDESARPIGVVTPQGVAMTVPPEALAHLFLNNFEIRNVSLIELVANEAAADEYWLYAEGENAAPEALPGSIRIMRFTTTLEKDKIFVPASSAMMGESCAGHNCI